MIAFSIFLFAVLVLAWLMAPGSRFAIGDEAETAGMPPEAQTV